MPKNNRQSALNVWPSSKLRSTKTACGDYAPQSPQKMMRLSWLLSGLVYLFLLLSLTGCGSTEYIKVRQRDLPPAGLLQDCAEPSPTFVQTNGTLVAYVGELRSALRNCNNDKSALREWAKD